VNRKSYVAELRQKTELTINLNKKTIITLHCIIN